MLEKVLALKEKYVNAISENEKMQIDQEMKQLMEQDPDAWALAMVECAKQTADKAQELVKKVKRREQLESILPIISLSYIAEQYFNKSRHWLYQRINENKVNGKPAQFTAEEIKTLDFALQDISKKIGSIRVV